MGALRGDLGIESFQYFLTIFAEPCAMSSETCLPKMQTLIWVNEQKQTFGEAKVQKAANDKIHTFYQAENNGNSHADKWYKTVRQDCGAVLSHWLWIIAGMPTWGRVEKANLLRGTAGWAAVEQLSREAGRPVMEMELNYCCWWWQGNCCTPSLLRLVPFSTV